MILRASISLVLLRPVDGVVLSGIITLARGVPPGRLGVLDVDDAQVLREALSYSYSSVDESRLLGALPCALCGTRLVLPSLPEESESRRFSCFGGGGSGANPNAIRSAMKAA